MTPEAELESVRRELAAARAELAQARREQAATSEILEIIAASDERGVFDTIVQTAKRLLGAHSVRASVYWGGFAHTVAFTSTRPDVDAEVNSAPPTPLAGNRVAQEIMGGRHFEIPDIEADDPVGWREFARRRGYRSCIVFPLARRGATLGSLIVSRANPGVFAPNEIQLLRTFADQAVIAIENARLFEETRARTRELAARNSAFNEQIQHQSATIEILKAMSASPGDAQPVFDVIVQRAMQICDAEIAVVLNFDGAVCHLSALAADPASTSPEVVAAYRRLFPQPPSRASVALRAVERGEIVHIPNMAEDAELSKASRDIGHKGALAVPLMSEGRVVGSIGLSAKAPGGFSPTQIALLKTFAEQAVIALRSAETFRALNARTRDLEESLAQQTATANVLKVISRSAFDLQSVFDTLLNSALELVGGIGGAIALREGDKLRFRAGAGPQGHAITGFVGRLLEINRSTASGRAITTGQTVYIPDATQDPEFRSVASDAWGRSYLGVPLSRESKAEGVLTIIAEQSHAFTPRHIELVESFADQAVIAIENARLFDEVQARTHDLQESLDQQTATADVLKVISGSAFDLEAVFDALLASAVALSGANGGAICVREGEAFPYRAIGGDSVSPEFRRFMMETPARPGRGSVAGRALMSGKVEQIFDIRQEPDFQVPTRALGNPGRGVLGVPLLREDRVEGALVLIRNEPGYFTARQIELMQTFADQAVIALHNARLFKEVQARTRDLEESLAQQTATADVLKIISSSAFKLQPVLDAMAESAVRLCEAERAVIFQFDGTLLRAVATHNCGPEFREFLDHNPIAPGRDTVSARAALQKRTVQVADVQLDPEYGYVTRDVDPIRTTVSVPMLKGDRLVGTITIFRLEVRPFTDNQIKLVETFAEQAVIAIENARLFEEVQARTRDLEEALAQQTATADVLKIISRSAFDVRAVYDSLLAAAVDLVGAIGGSVTVRDNDRFEVKSVVSANAEYRKFLGQSVLPSRRTGPGRALLSGRTEIIRDMDADPEYVGRAIGVPARSGLSVPLLVEGQVVGAIALLYGAPDAVRPRHVQLLETFADQAAIAIGNSQLFEQVQARTRDLEEALAQQTATANALKVISRSALGLREVMQTLIDSAVRLCANDGVVYLRKGDVFLAEAAFDANEEKIQARNRTPRTPGRGSMTGRVALSGEIEFIPDTHEDDRFEIPPEQRLKGIRSLVGVPLLREGRVEGVFILGKREPGRFGERAVALARTFADQAVIVIENVRLFEDVQARTRELEESLAQQTATADVLKVISRSAFDLQVVLDTLVGSAIQLCGVSSGLIYLRRGDEFYLSSAVNMQSDPIAEKLRQNPQRPGRGSIGSRILLTGQIQNVADVQQDPDYDPELKRAIQVRGLLGVPLKRDDVVVGAFVLRRAEPGLFDDRHVELVKTFADQAVIAVENARLLDEVQARTRDLEGALAQQTATADVLKTISRSAFDLQAVLDTLVASAVRLFGADNGIMYLQRGDAFYVRAAYNTVEFQHIIERLRERPHYPGRGSVGARVLLTGDTQHVPDLHEDEEYDPKLRAASVGRAVLGVPMNRDGEVVGAIVFVRREAGAYAARHIEIAKTFADQAVIAIENARLFDEVQSRTRELERSLADLRKAQDRLVQSEKLASLGQLTAGIAHEIKNPLNFVNNFAALSRELLGELKETLARLPADAQADAEEVTAMLDSNLDKVVHHGQRADSIIKNMLLHAREGSGERARVKVNAMVEEALNLAYHGARAEKPGFNVTIETALDPDAGEAELYLQEITRVLLNLISNGFYSTAKRKLGEGDGYAPTLRASTRARGASVEIRIRDNGTGIAEDVRAKMFNPFFTTKPAGEGTGLGLSLSHDIVVKQHGGTIEVDSGPGFAEFVVTLPREGAKAG
jgi:two-component system, NtrC family, sensor kinase